MSQQVPLDHRILFAVSTLVYCLRGKTPHPKKHRTGELKAWEDEELRGLLGLPEEETWLVVRDTNHCLLPIVSRGLKGQMQKLFFFAFAKATECEQLKGPDI